MAEPRYVPAGSLRALDWLNFFVADIQTGFGPFIAVHLTRSKWTQTDIGLMLGLGTLVSLLCQVPGGALVDAFRSKRGMVALGVTATGLSALFFAFWPSFLLIALAETLHGGAGAVLVPAIAAVSLGLVGHESAGARFARNARFAAVGTAVAAGLMGV